MHQGFQELKKGAIATHYNADGTIAKVMSTKNPNKEVDGIYELFNENNEWKWKTVE